jgi:hypothetical protein
MSGEGYLVNGLLRGLDLADRYNYRRQNEALAKTRDERDQILFDRKMESYDLEQEIKRREDAGRKLYSLSLDKDGRPRKFTAQDNEFIKHSVVPVMNKGGIFSDYLTSNPDVDPDNPIARIDIQTVYDPETKEQKDVVMTGLRMKDGTVKPTTMQRTNDPNDPLWTPTVDEFMRYAQIEADPRGTAARLMEHRNKQKDLERYKDKKLIDAGVGLDLYQGKKNIDLDYIQDLKSAGLDSSGKPLKNNNGGWSEPEATKFIKSLVATGMGLNSDHLDLLDENKKQEFATEQAQVWRQFMHNPNAGILDAYETVTGKKPEELFNELPQEQQDALAKHYLEERGIPKDESTWLGLGDPVYSEDKVNAAKAKLSLGIAEDTKKSKSKKEKPKSSKVYTAVIDGRKEIVTQADIETTARETGLSVEEVKRKFNIED